jgi:hypothetical protein
MGEVPLEVPLESPLAVWSAQRLERECPSASVTQRHTSFAALLDAPLE